MDVHSHKLPFNDPAVKEEPTIEASVDAPPPDPGSDLDERMARIRSELIGCVGNLDGFAEHVGRTIRAAIDYVIDAPTLFRYSVEELESDEKTTIGKRIERLLRFHLDIPRGKKLDIQLGGEDVDIKTTMRKQWMFAPNNYDHINLLIAYDESTSKYRIGLAYVTREGMNDSKNRDGKQSLSKKTKENIKWILEDQPYPPNILAHMSRTDLKTITDLTSGMQRVRALLRIVRETPIPRHVICSVANQIDPLRRIRKGGGARDVLWDEGYLVLSGKFACDSSIAKVVLIAKSIDLGWKKPLTLEGDEMMCVLKSSRFLTAELVEQYRIAHNLP